MPLRPRSLNILHAPSRADRRQPSSGIHGRRGERACGKSSGDRAGHGSSDRAHGLTKFLDRAAGPSAWAG